MTDTSYSELDLNSGALIEPQCRSCIHYHTQVNKPTCNAFPDGIPPKIWTGAVDHTEPVEGDHDFQYIRKPQ